MLEPSNRQQNTAATDVLRLFQANTAKLHRIAAYAGSTLYAKNPVTFGNSKVSGVNINTAPIRGSLKRNPAVTQIQTQSNKLDRTIFLFAVMDGGNGEWVVVGRSEGLSLF
jgi:hypothetical protein